MGALLAFEVARRMQRRFGMPPARLCVGALWPPHIHAAAMQRQEYTLESMMERLDIHDVAGLVRYAIRAGLVSPEK